MDFQLNSLLYAHDIVLLANSKEALQTFLIYVMISVLPGSNI